MRWRFWERAQPQAETRAQPYTDTVIELLANQAAGIDPAAASRTAVQEACAGLWARAFALAEVSPATTATAALTPDVLATVGRELCERGQVVFEITVASGGVRLRSASDWTISGQDADAWLYELVIPTPSAIITRYRMADGVLHLRYSADVREPWNGAGAFERASTSRQLSGRLETRLAEEAAALSGTCYRFRNRNPNGQAAGRYPPAARAQHSGSDDRGRLGR